MMIFIASHCYKEEDKIKWMPFENFGLSGGANFERMKNGQPPSDFVARLIHFMGSNEIKACYKPTIMSSDFTANIYQRNAQLLIPSGSIRT